MNGRTQPAQGKESFFSSPLTYRPNNNFNPTRAISTSQGPTNPFTPFVFGADNTNFPQTHNTEWGYGLRVGTLEGRNKLDLFKKSQHHAATLRAHDEQQHGPYIAHPSYTTRPSLAQLLLSVSPPSTLEAANPIPSPEIPSFTTPIDPEPPLALYESFNAKRLKPTQEWCDENISTPSALATSIAEQKPLHFDYGYKYMQSFVPTVDVEDGSKRDNVRFLIADNRGNRKQRLRKRYVRVEDVAQRSLPVMPERQLGDFALTEVIEDDGNEFEEGDI